MNLDVGEEEYRDMVKENKSMKYKLFYMQKLARYEVYGVEDEIGSVDSSEFSS